MRMYYLKQWRYCRTKVRELTRDSLADWNLCRFEQNRPLATLTHAGYPDRYDQSMAQGSRFAVCSKSVGEDSLPGYGPVISGNRLCGPAC